MKTIKEDVKECLDKLWDLYGILEDDEVVTSNDYEPHLRQLDILSRTKIKE